MRIIIATLTGKRIILDDIKPDDNFQLVNSILFENEGYPEDTPRYIFAGKEIMQANTFQYYNIQTESLIHCVLRLRGGTGVTEKPFPTLGMIYHGGITIHPSFPFDHKCDKESYKENYRMVYKSNEALYYSHPLRISFDLSKLCLPRKCFPESSKDRGAGFVVDETRIQEMRCRLRVFELVDGKLSVESHVKLLRNRKLVLDTLIGDTRPSLTGGKFYRAKDQRSTPQEKIVKNFYPKGKRQWKRNSRYICLLHNHYGGFRWTFSTSSFLEENDLNERVEFLRAEKKSFEIKLLNMTLYSTRGFL